MPLFELRFQIPGAQAGRLGALSRRLLASLTAACRSRVRRMGSAKVTDVHVMGGSLFGSISIQADRYESALALVRASRS